MCAKKVLAFRGISAVVGVRNISTVIQLQRVVNVISSVKYLLAKLSVEWPKTLNTTSVKGRQAPAHWVYSRTARGSFHTNGKTFAESNSNGNGTLYFEFLTRTAHCQHEKRLSPTRLRANQRRRFANSPLLVKVDEIFSRVNDDRRGNPSRLTENRDLCGLTILGIANASKLYLGIERETRLRTQFYLLGT